MTDKHLIMFIRNYRRQLQDAIDAATQLQPKGSAVVFAPFHKLIERLGEDIATLEGEREAE